MATVTDPIILDSTGQAIKNSIDLLSANINRTASNIPYDSNLTIKGKIDEIDAKTAADIPYSSGVSIKDKLDSKIGISLFGTYTKSASVETGYYPTNKPFIATAYGSGNVASMFCANRLNLGKFLYLDSTHRIYFNSAGAFGLGDVENGTTVEIYQID